MTIEKMALVVRQIRLFLLAMGALSTDRGGRRRAPATLPSLHHLFVAGRPSMENSLPRSGEVHRAERAEIGRRVALAVPLRRLRRVAGQLMALKRHQRPHYPRAQLALHPLLILVARRQTLLVARLLRVYTKLQVVTEPAVATGARQAPLPPYHDRHRAVHHRDHVSVARVEQMTLHSLVFLAPKVARGASVAAAYLKNRGGEEEEE